MSDIPIIHGYSIGQLLDKTIVAERKVYVYTDARSNAVPEGYVSPGQPVGVLYSWLNVNLPEGRDRIWLMFYPPNAWSGYYYAPFNDGDFDWSSIQQQGAITILEQQEQEEQEKNDSETPWYEKIFTGVNSEVIKPVINGALILGGLYVGVKYILPEIMKHTSKRKKQEA